ncbi:MAG: acyltransferase [Acidiphilium sp.]|nr:acyltransferase [Acidiphilium sp.]MDD4936634.1 acyltransferase [Acidiphilium sp.]
MALDGLRGVAALAVACFHIFSYFQLPFYPYHAYLAVDFFFMLSGFVIAHSYDRRLSGQMKIRGFLKVRLIRLYPLVLLGILLGTSAFLLAALVGGHIYLPTLLQAAATNALLLPSPAMTYLRPWAFPVDTPLWSLAFEFWINILYACCFKYLNKISLTAALLLGAVLLCWTAITFNGLDVGYAWPSFYLGGARVLFPFVLGIVMSRYLLSHTTYSQWAHATWLPLVAILFAPAFMGGYYDIVAVLLIFPLILLVAAHAGTNRFFDPLWRQLGIISYPLYVLQYPFVVVLSNVAKAHHLAGFALATMVLLTMLIIITVATLASRFYDIPVRKYLTYGTTATRVKVVC